MKNLSSREIRSLFLDFFKEKGHTVVKSSSLVPAEDPTLLFTNAGMVQFKKVFLGEESRPYSRATSCQKCVRAGGKHNDLENVGYTARHHTFFEMLGNFSFGDYFKAEAIAFAWEFLTKRLELPVEKLWVTVFEKDDEAAKLWHEIAGVSKDRIVRLGEKDNFWAMGDTGPCGPCSEILIDQGPDIGCGRPDCKVGCDCDRYLELWNLVFMQYDRDESGTLNPLPRPSIDTGMGLERIAAICQGKTTNFDTDCFSGLLEKISDLAGIGYGQDRQKDVAMRVISDHARASAFLISDGVLPSNEGRGYVLRRIIRRAVRYGRVLGLEAPFMAEMADKVIEEMGDIYPELLKSQSFMGKVLNHEERRFSETLEFGLQKLSEEIDNLRSSGKDLITGEFIFKLYDTYGFPVDIVQDIAKEQGINIDHAGFDSAMQAQRDRSRRSAKAGSMDSIPEIYRDLAAQDKGKTFIGYDCLKAVSSVLTLVSNNTPYSRVEKGWKGEMIASFTPFYAESGGQVGDTGLMETETGRARVVDTVKKAGLIVHIIEVEDGVIEVEQEVSLSVDRERRLSIARHHTSTHILHAALRKVLGDHVRQAGSMVSFDRFRFDFTHFKALTQDELHKIEDLVNQQIVKNISVRTTVLSYEQAIARGALAFFEEKYGDEVRVVEMHGWSMELCGGTHVKATGEIGLFKIIGESSVASGIRRIEAVSAFPAMNFVRDQENILLTLQKELKTPAAQLVSRVKALESHIKDLEKEIEEARSRLNRDQIDGLLKQVRDVNGIKVLSAQVNCNSVNQLREMGDRLRDKLESSYIVILGSKINSKAMLLALVGKDITSKIKAGDIVKKAAECVGGGGGGRPDMAQAGGSRPEHLSVALDKAFDFIKDVLK